jgi:hypothetical protein
VAAINSTAYNVPGIQGLMALTDDETWQEVERRLSERSVRSGACLLWTGVLTYSGYGQISIRDKKDNAHRAAYRVWVGPIPEGLEIDHLCNVRNCIEPTHLEAVTHAENIRRRYARQVECVNGHRLAETAYLSIRGSRVCRACKADARKKYRAAIKAASC